MTPLDPAVASGVRRPRVAPLAHRWQVITLVVLVALACRVVLAMPAFGDVQRFYIVPDSYEYDQLAINLVQGRGYSQASVPPYPPDVRRTPAYPLLLAAVYAVVGHRPELAVAVNVLLGVLACLLTAALAGRLFGAGPGLLAGPFLAVDLTSAVYSLTLMAETLFTVLVLIAILSSVRYLRAGGGWSLAQAGSWCGVAILARPIGLFLPIVLGPALALLSLAGSRRARLLAAGAFVALTLAFPLGWTIRNYQEAGVAQLTSLVAINAYYHRAAQIEAERQGIPVEAVRREFAQAGAAGGPGADEGPADLAAMQRRALDLVLGDPIGYLALHLRGAVRLLEPDKDVWVQLRAGAPEAAGLPGSFAEFVTAEPHPHVAMGGPVQIVAALQLGLVYALAVAGAMHGWRRLAWRRATVLSLLMVAYFVALSGPEGYARFRVPAMPFVVLLAALGAWAWCEATAHRRTRVPGSPGLIANG